MIASADELDNLSDLGGDSEDEVLDKRKHAQLIDAIASLDGKKSHHVSQRTVPTAQVSEFGFSGNANKDRVTLHALVGSLKDSANHGELKKHLRTVEKRSKVVSVPLPKHEKVKIERCVAFEKTSQELEKWDNVVKQNRQADQLAFPLYQPSLRLHTAGKFRNLQPKTPLEIEVAALLTGSKNVHSKKKELTPSEEKALQAMSIEEAKERRAELQKHRALLSYKESKARWQKKIKSKKYHKVLRKEKLKHEKKALDNLQQNDPEGYQEKIDNLNKQRIQERMNLKHRGGSKFAKKQMIYAKYDDKARQSVQDMLQKSRELTSKIITEATESDSDGGVAMDSEDEAAMLESELGKEEETKQKNPWMTLGIKKSTSTSEPTQTIDTDFKQDILKFSVVEENVSHQVGENGHENSDEIDEIFSEMKSENSKKKKKKMTQTVDKKKKNDNKRKLENSKKEKNLKKKKIQRQKVQNKTQNDDEAFDEDDEDEELITETLTRKRTLEDIENDRLDDSREVEIKKRKPTKLDKESTKEQTKKIDEVHVDPKKLFTLESKLMNIETPNVTEGQSDDENEDLDADEQQRLTIAQAFENDDVIDEFTKEKTDIVDRDKPKDIDLALPGWGDWGGTGLKIPKFKRKRFIKKAAAAEPRKDRSLGHVIISELKDESIRKHQVSELPFPYVNVKQFEQSISAPVGKNWNPETAFKQLIKPKVVTKIGSVIEPIDKTEVFKNTQTKQKKADMTVDNSVNNKSKSKKQKLINRKRKGRQSV